RPAFQMTARPSSDKPQGCGRAAAALDEIEPFSVGDRAVSKPEWMDERAVARRFIVKGEAAAIMADIVNAAGKRYKAQRFRLAAIRAGAGRPVGRFQRIGGKKRKNIGQHQLLMLLFMVDADFDEPRQLWTGFAATCK